MLHFNLLGSAAGGGVPQWNCACSICDLCRNYPEQVQPRLQLQAAFSCNSDSWFLINASPDLRFQIEGNRSLHPSPRASKRNTPIKGILLTSADLDSVLGVLLLREFQPLTIYATSLVREILESNSFFIMLTRVESQLTWVEITPDVTFSLEDGLLCTPISLSDSLPYYVRQGSNRDFGLANIGLIIESGPMRIAYTPSVPEITDKLKTVYDSCEIIFVDGTFWSNSELRQIHDDTPLARSIGHVPMSGEDGTIALLANTKCRNKIFIHINNTNPVLNRKSAEYETAREAGWQIGYDGWKLN